MKPSKIYSYVCSNCQKEFTRKSSFKQGEPIICHGCKITLYYVAHPEDAARRTKKAQSTCISKYGAYNVSKVPDVKQKISEGLKASYSDPEKKQETLRKRGDTNQKRYGYRHASQNPEIVAKGLATQRSRNNGYVGWEDPEKQKASEAAAHSKGANVKRETTHLETCKDLNAVRSLNNSNKLKGYVFENRRFDSSWELAVYIYLRDSKRSFTYHPDICFHYTDENNIDHTYWPDFLIDGKLYELKGEQFFNANGEPFNRYTGTFWWNKYKSMQDNDVTIVRFDEMRPYLRYVSEKYGKGYLKSFKIR